MKRSDIPDEEILRAIRQRRETKLGICAALPQYPMKLLKAKVQHMIDRKILECGVNWNFAWENK
jgi:hypothetical protein